MFNTQNLGLSKNSRIISNVLLLALVSLVSFLINYSTFAQVVYPTGYPTGEVQGGTFQSYFTNMFTYCTNGSAVQGFSTTGVPLCTSLSSSANAVSMTGAMVGTTNFISKYTLNGTLLTNSQLYDNGANVGIGTASPTAKLSIVGASNPTVFDISETSANGHRWGFGSFGTLGGYNTSGFGIADWTVGAWRMYIDGAGSVGIGTTSPSGRLIIGDGGDGWVNRFTIRSNYPTIKLQDTDGIGAFIHNNGNLLYFLRGCGNDDSGQWCSVNGWWPLYLNLNNNDATFGGNIYAFNYYYNSDINFKKDLQPIQGALDKIKHLNGYYFTWKKDDVKSVGVIAQEVEKVFPEIVGQTKDGSGTVYKTVEYGNLVAPIIEAVKELSNKFDFQQDQSLIQQNEITALQIENNNLHLQNQELATRISIIEKQLNTIK